MKCCLIMFYAVSFHGDLLFWNKTSIRIFGVISSLLSRWQIKPELDLSAIQSIGMGPGSWLGKSVKKIAASREGPHFLPGPHLARFAWQIFLTREPVCKLFKTVK